MVTSAAGGPPRRPGRQGPPPSPAGRWAGPPPVGGVPGSRPDRPGERDHLRRAPLPAPRREAAGARPARGAPRRGRRRLGDPRGLTVTGAVVLVLGVGVLAGAVDVLTGAGLRTLFAVAFTAACALAALTVHREQVHAAVVMPPLLYLALTLVAGVVDPGASTGGWAQQQVAELAEALVYQAPVLFTATGAAAAVALLRWLSARSPRPR